MFWHDADTYDVAPDGSLTPTGCERVIVVEHDNGELGWLEPLDVGDLAQESLTSEE